MTHTHLKICIFALPLLFWGCTKEPLPPAEPQTKTLTLWTATTPKFFEALGREFDLQHPDDIRFEIKEFESNTTLQEELINTLAEGESPDIIVTKSDWIRLNTKKLLPLHDQTSLTTTKYRELFHPGTHHLIAQDKIWGIPLSVETLAIMSNIEHLNERLTTDTDLSTWESVQDKSRRLTTTDNSLSRFATTGLALGGPKTTHNGQEAALTLLVQKIGSPWDPTHKKWTLAEHTTNPAKNVWNDKTQEVLTFFQSFSDPSSPNYSWNKLLAHPVHKDFEPFLRGKTSLIIVTPKDFEQIQNRIKSLRDSGERTISPLNIQVHPLPTFSETKKGPLADITALAVPFPTPHKKTAWEFVKYTIKEEYARIWSRESHTPTALKSLLREQKSDPILRPFAQQTPQALPYLAPILKRDFETQLIEILHSPITSQKLKTWQNELNKGNKL